MQAPVATVAQSPLSQSSLAMYQRQGMPASDSAAPAVKAEAQPADSQAAGTETVSLHTAAELQAMGATQQAASTAGHPPEIFAEIWKDGMRIGTVYTNGEAVMSPPSAGVTGGGQGSTMPYLRAQEISRMVGGEVRYVDLPALQVAQTRSQLRAAYGA